MARSSEVGCVISHVSRKGRHGAPGIFVRTLDWSEDQFRMRHPWVDGEEFGGAGGLSFPMSPETGDMGHPAFSFAP